MQRQAFFAVETVFQTAGAGRLGITFRAADRAPSVPDRAPSVTRFVRQCGGRFPRRRLCAAVIGGLLMATAPGQAATCVEGLIMLEKTLRKVDLKDDEFNIVTELMFRAKVEADRGNMQKCVYIVGDIIRLVFLQKAN